MKKYTASSPAVHGAAPIDSRDYAPIANATGLHQDEIPAACMNAWESLSKAEQESLWAFLYCTRPQTWDRMTPATRGSIAKTLLIPEYREQWEGAQ